jgi:cyclopropane fatty-acyl-phospholipid synthase-like methyltransferase
MDNIKYLYETKQQVNKYIDRPISLILKEIIKKEIKNNSNILDFGCGDGKILKYIISKKKDVKE